MLKIQLNQSKLQLNQLKILVIKVDKQLNHNQTPRKTTLTSRTLHPTKPNLPKLLAPLQLNPFIKVLMLIPKTLPKQKVPLTPIKPNPTIKYHIELLTSIGGREKSL